MQTQSLANLAGGTVELDLCFQCHGLWFDPQENLKLAPAAVAEITNIAKSVAVIHCNSCGAPVDLRKDAVCPHCRSAFSLLDPQAVEHALQGYAHTAAVAAATAAEPASIRAPKLADAGLSIDLWALGVSMVHQMLD